jgi:hypothetical protein
MASTEKNRASAAAMNAEVRRTKARLMDEIPKLRKLALKKVNLHWFFFFYFFYSSLICATKIRQLLNLGIETCYINTSYSFSYTDLWLLSYLILVPIVYKILLILTQFLFFGMKYILPAKTM